MSKNTFIIHHVPEQVEPERLADYAKGIFPQYPSKTAIKKLIKRSELWVNEHLGTTATYIKGGEIIKVAIPQAKATTLKLKLEVLHEDDHLAIINKPAGLLVSGNRLVTLANALPQNLQSSPCQDACTPWPVHRLDYGTTGVLVVGKTSQAIRLVSEQFQSQQVKKLYYAICIGEMPAEGRIEKSIDDKTALTNFKVLDHVHSERFQKLNLVQLKPDTGRRHQLRKHLSALGNPILGDRDYGFEGLILKGKGIYLHAFSISFLHPHFQHQVEFSAALPKKYGKIFQAYSL